MQILKKYITLYKIRLLIGISVALFLVLVVGGFFGFSFTQNLQSSSKKTQQQLKTVQNELQTLKQVDQVKRNDALQEELKKTHDTFTSSLSSFEQIQDLKSSKQDTSVLDKLYASILKDLSDNNSASATANLSILGTEINKATATLASKSVSSGVSNAPLSNSAPSSGFSSQQVTTSGGVFTVSMVAGDLNSTRVIVDTASESDCSNNCPVLSLADYVGRNGAFAGINGAFFCPPEYPSCAGKTNSFDTLLMNKNKHYFNSDNNKYSTVPLIYFSGNTGGIRSQTLDWGRDTGVDAVIANFPVYVLNGNNTFGGSGDPKITNKGTRTFIGIKGNTAYMGIIYSASAEDAAAVLSVLKLDNALGLDQGGSTALWSGGYKAGPGRNLPSAVLFVHK